MWSVVCLPLRIFPRSLSPPRCSDVFSIPLLLRFPAALLLIAFLLPRGHSDSVGDQKTEKPVLDTSNPASKPASKMAGDHGNVHVINNSAAWDAKLEEGKHASKIVVVDFTATWCGPCRLMSPIFTELSKKFENLIFLKVDVDEVQDVTAKWEVRAMPTFVFIKDGKLLDKIVGANKDELARKITHYATTTVTASA